MTLPVHYLLLAFAMLGGVLTIISYALGTPSTALAFLMVAVITAAGWYSTRSITGIDVVKYDVLVEVDGAARVRGDHQLRRLNRPRTCRRG